MEAHLTRGRLLYSRGRYEAAEAEFRKALTEAPDDPFALGMLALAISQQRRLDEALEAAHEAVGQGPDIAFTHHALAIVHLERDEYLKAKAAIEVALRLDQDEPDYWSTLASIHVVREEFAEALHAARKGLEVDSEHAGCRNLQAVAFTQLGRHAEAAATIEGRLQQDPDDAMAHANQGWSHLHQNRPRDAAVHFREALRLDPELEFARAGMLNALRARNPLFRLLLAYFLWMSRLSPGVRWGVIIGGWFVYRAVRQMGEQSPTLRYWTMPIVVLYLLFVFMSWTGPTLANLMLRLDKFGRHVLSPEEIRASNFVLTSLLLMVFFGVVAAVTWSLTFALAAGLFLIMIIPISGTFGVDNKRGRTALAAYTIVLFVLGAGAVASIDTFPPLAGLLGLPFLLGLFAFSWIANAIQMHKPN